MTSDIIDRFCAEYHDYHDISVDRRKMQRRVLEEWQAHFERPLPEAGASDLQAYLATLIASGMAPSTVRKNLNAIKPFVKWMWRQKLIDAERRMEFDDVPPPRGGGVSRPKPYKRDQLKVFWREFEAAYPIDDRFDYWLRRWSTTGTSGWRRIQPHAKRLQMEAIIALALYGGIRREEIYRLKIVDMHHENGYVVVNSARKNKENESIERAVPWTCQEMRDRVRAWLEFRETLPTTHDRPWLSLHTEAHYLKPLRWRAFEVLLGNIGRGWEYHRMRHTCATELLRNGVPLEVVQKILGHKRIQQTLAYAELIADDVVAAASRSESEFSATMAETRAA